MTLPSSTSFSPFFKLFYFQKSLKHAKSTGHKKRRQVTKSTHTAGETETQTDKIEQEHKQTQSEQEHKQTQSEQEHKQTKLNGNRGRNGNRDRNTKRE
jgi:hypothetical protein